MTKIRKRKVCYGCGKEGTITWDTNKQEWIRKVSCRKCGSGSFEYYNY